MYLQIHTSPASTVNHSFIVLNEKHCLCSSFPLSFDMLPLQFIVPMFHHTIKSNKKIRFLQRLKSFTELFTTFRFQWINQRFDKTKRMKPSIKRRRIKTMRAYIKISTKRYNNKKTQRIWFQSHAAMLIMKNFSFLRHSIKCIIRNVVCIMHGKTFDIFHVYMDEIEWVRIKAAIARCGSKMWNKKSRFARTQHELMNRQIRNVVADIVHFSCMVAYLPVQQLILRIIFLCSTYLRHISLSSLLFPPTRLSMRFTFTFHSVFFFVSLHFWLRCMASRVLESIFPSIHSSICSFVRLLVL